MRAETVGILRDIFKDSKPIPLEEEAEWNVNAFRDIGGDLILATTPQLHRRTRATQLDTSMNKLTETASTHAAPETKSKRIKVNGLGKCAFIDLLYVQGGHTKAQILALTLKAFPDSDEKSTRNTVNLRPGYVTKSGKTPKWETEPTAAK